MDVKARVANEPAAYGRNLVRAVVVEDEMEVEVVRSLAVDCLEKLEELLAAMPPMQVADDAP